jgi:hypothetical protein
MESMPEAGLANTFPSLGDRLVIGVFGIAGFHDRLGVAAPTGRRAWHA